MSDINKSIYRFNTIKPKFNSIYRSPNETKTISFEFANFSRVPTTQRLYYYIQNELSRNESNVRYVNSATTMKMFKCKNEYTLISKMVIYYRSVGGAGAFRRPNHPYVHMTRYLAKISNWAPWKEWIFILCPGETTFSRHAQSSATL